MSNQWQQWLGGGPFGSVFCRDDGTWPPRPDLPAGVQATWVGPTEPPSRKVVTDVPPLWKRVLLRAQPTERVVNPKGARAGDYWVRPVPDEGAVL